MNRAGTALPVMVAAVGAAASYALFAPGYVTFDSIIQFREALDGRYSNQHPPLMAMLWGLTHALLPGAAGLLAVQMAAWWAGLLLHAQASGRGPWFCAIAVAVVGAFPPLAGLLGHVWKDGLMLALVTLGSGLLALGARRRARFSLIAAILVLAVASALRHNAFAITLPLALLAGWQLSLHPRARVLAATSAAAVMLAVAPTVERLPQVVRFDVWSVSALCDLVGVSIRTGRMYIPAELRGPDLTPADLARDFRAWTCVSSLISHPIKSDFVVRYSDAERRALRRAWLALPKDAPGALIAHRLSVVKPMLGLDRRGVPADQILPLDRRDLPGLPAPAQSAWQTAAIAALADARTGPLFWPWLYLLATVPLMWWAWRRRDEQSGRHALALAAGAWATLGVLTLVVPSSEFRFMAFAVACPWLMAMLLVGTRTDAAGRLASVSASARPA